METRLISINEIFDANNSDLLFTAYTTESKTEVTTAVLPSREIFSNLENANLITTIGIFSDLTLVGFAIFTVSVSPHYSEIQTNIMSIFILKEYRKGGAAKKLFAFIEKLSIARNSKLIIVSSPINGILGKFVPRLGYVPNNILYCKDLR